MDHPGHTKLRAWREGVVPPLSQARLAKNVGTYQSLIAEWENEASNRRPGFETAVALEAETAGAVRVEDWGYERSLLTSVASLVDRRRAGGDSLAPDVDPAAEVA